MRPATYEPKQIIEAGLALQGSAWKTKLSHAKTVFCTMWCRLCVMSGIFRIPA